MISRDVLTLRHRKTGKIFIAEMKCELSLDNHSYLVLEGVWQLEHHLNKKAFRNFIHAATRPAAFEVLVGGRSGGEKIEVDGAILIWGATSSRGREEVMKRCGFADVLSLEMMLIQLLEDNFVEWRKRMNQLGNWSMNLFLSGQDI